MKRPIIVVGLGFGDEGKGTVVDALVRRHDLKTCVRFNGGAQAAHNVVTDDGRHHTFSQFGSGTFVPGVKTFLSRFMLVNPGAMLNEEAHLRTVGVHDAFDRMFIDGRALITTPYHQIVNRCLEKSRGENRHGSCGMGIGETVADGIERPQGAVRASDLTNSSHEIAEKVESARNSLIARHPKFYNQLLDYPIQQAVKRLVDFALQCDIRIVDTQRTKEILNEDGLIFEGAQGALLDEDFGFHPHTTWSRTTAANAVALLRESGNETPPFKVGVTRTFLTRHGDGPFPTEDPSLAELVKDDHNQTGEFQGVFRVGKIDPKLFDYAIDMNGGVDALAITHCDKIPHLLRTGKTIGIEILLKSHGQKYEDKEFNDTASVFAEASTRLT